MKNILLACLLLPLSCINAFAQNTETIKVPAGHDIAEAISAYGIYRFPAFEKGSIFFRDGKMGRESFNYNILNDQLMYIDQKGDTLAIAAPEEIKKTAINGTVFYYDKKGWLEAVEETPAASLLVKRRIRLHYEKEGAFGISNSTNGIDSYTSFVSGNASYHLYVSDEVTVKKITNYFLLTKDDRFLPASRANFLSLFAKNKSQIDRYLDTHKVNFSKEEDLRQLLAACIADSR